MQHVPRCRQKIEILFDGSSQNERESVLSISAVSEKIMLR